MSSVGGPGHIPPFLDETESFRDESDAMDSKQMKH